MDLVVQAVVDMCVKIYTFYLFAAMNCAEPEPVGIALRTVVNVDACIVKNA